MSFPSPRCVYGQTSIILDPRNISALSKFEDDKDEFKRKTKIICTMGPSCWSVEKICELVDEGMTVARLNFSHGDFEAHQKTIDNIREAQKLRPNIPIATLLDTKGPEIRSGFFKPECDGKINLKNGQKLTVTTNYEYLGDENKIACSYKKLPSSVSVGGIILLADGSLSLKIEEILSDEEILTTVMNDAVIGERKNMNLPGVKVDLPVIGEKDKNDIVNFAIPNGMNFVAASFVQTGEDIDLIRSILGPRGRHVKIIAKIENEEGIKNFSDILEKSDGIMVARGDLGMEIPAEKVFLVQKMLIGMCNVAGKPVITATQMLESMVKNPRPTRAEASDVANAVLDGTDVVMLSGETAGGSFPREACHIMRRICEEAEHYIDYNTLYASLRQNIRKYHEYIGTPEAVCSSAVKTGIDIDCKLIIALSETGSTAKLIAKYRPGVPILALSASESTTKHLQIHRGVISTLVPSFQGTDHVIKSAIAHAKNIGLVQTGDKIVAVHGVREEVSGHTNLMKVLEVE